MIASTEIAATVRFADVTDRSGTSTGLATFGVATADYNNDGRPDLVVGDFGAGYRLYANAGVYDKGNSRLKVRLRGAGPVNGDGVGSRVRVTTGDGRSQMRDVRIGSTSAPEATPPSSSGWTTPHRFAWPCSGRTGAARASPTCRPTRSST